ncbi:D-alanyl-D-alanine carboxypeptidase family protein [Microbacterium sp. RU33B]|uniref:D-alanyl-D-alanine carboxypeptidase family protein n=1 Tax=Microbacterium sp. RU33B TaxID=1907390 RepID=UPI002116EBE4|nr:D-alanyl-D-alanine carboxypeptidase family protein [Microbacterium sp. RU33B]
MLPRWVTDAAAGSAEAAAGAEERSTPRRARSTFTTERKRPHATSKPLPPLEPVVPDIDLTDPVVRDRPASAISPVRARVAVSPTRDPEAPLVTGEVPVAAGLVDTAPATTPPAEVDSAAVTAAEDDVAPDATVERVEMPAPAWAPPSAPVQIVVPPRPPLPEVPADELPTRRQRRARSVEDPIEATAEPIALDARGQTEDVVAPQSAADAVAPPGEGEQAVPAESETADGAAASPEDEPRVPLLRRLRRRITGSDDDSRTPTDLADTATPAPDPVSESESIPDAEAATDEPAPESVPEPAPESADESVPEPAPESADEPKPSAPSPRPTRRSSRAAGPASAPIPTPVAPEPEPLPDADPEAPEEGVEPSPASVAAPDDLLPKHAQTRRSARIRAGLGMLVAAVLVMGSAAAVTAAVTGEPVAEPPAARVVAEERAVETEASVAVPLPAPAQSIPAPDVTAAAAFVDVCSDPAFTAAIAAGDDAGAIALAGGGELFRAAVASGSAPCVPLNDPSRVWVVINKLRPYEPIDYSPPELVVPVGVRDLAGSPLRVDAGAALAAMITAAAGAGAGEIALSSGYRSYGVQRSTYASQVSARGTDGADLVSARPGYSEHQSGLAADVVACADGGCGGLDTFAGTPQAAWVAEHAWEFGWVVRYEDGATGVSGYSPEPWHLRYLGTELAAAYHAGGFHTVEEFLGLPAAPNYAD